MKRIFTATFLIILIGLLHVSAQERIYTPELSLPANGAVDQMPDVVLDWNGVTGGNTGIIKYDIQLDTEPSFTDPVNFETEFLTAVKASTLLFGETYYWRVRARDGNDVSGWSETRSFRVIRRVILAGPNDASTQNDTVKIRWNSISGVIEYDYQFDTVYYWKTMPSGQTSNLFSVSVMDESHAWAVGAGGTALFYNGSSWVEQESNISTDLYNVSFVDASNGWAVGKGGKITRFNGTAWAAQTSGTTSDLLGVSMLDASNGWAVGKAGVVLHYDGSTWSTQYTASKDLNKVFALDATHVWAVGKSGMIIFFNGTSWSVQETGGTIKEFLNVGFASADNGWAVGKSGFIMQYTGGEWSIYNHTLTTKDLTGIFFTGPGNAWIVGKTGTVLQYDGIEWFSQSGTTTTNFNDVSFAGDAGFISGENGLTVKFNDDAFTSPMATVYHVPGTATSTKIIDLLFGTQYYWRMRTKHALDISEWSGAQSFNTRATVTLENPDDDDVDVNLNETLTWKNQFSEMVSYEIQVDEDPAYGSPIFMATSSVEIEAELLKFGIQYNWRVRALHAFDISDWSTSWKFTTINTVMLTSPVNNEENVKLSPLLKWEAQTGIISYQVQVADDNSFSNLVATDIVPVAENSYSVPVVLEKDAVYYWKVRAINGLDTSGWSSAWAFKTAPPVGIDEPGLNGKINIFPNPAENTVYMQLKDKLDLSLWTTITDLVGKKVYEKYFLPDVGNKILSLDVSSLQNGIYMLRVTDGENTFTKKLIIKR